MLSHAPQLTLADARAVASELFALTGSVHGLPSERDQNFLVTTPGGQARFVLKVANRDETRAMLEAENAAMSHLAGLGLTPTLVLTRDGEPIGRHGSHFVRLVTALEGRPWGATRHHTRALFEDLGRTMATIDDRLTSFDHPAAHRHFYWDLAGAELAIRAGLVRISDPALTSALAKVLEIAAATVTPALPSFTQGVIHGDANEHNVLVDPGRQRVTGLVDFGDMVFSHVINDLAIAMAYGSLGKPDPLGAAALVARGYHAVRPLRECEIGALFGLLLLRLGLSVTVAARQQAERPDNDYLSVSQRAIRHTLPVLLAVHPRLAEYRFREACSLPPVPHSARVAQWLRRHANDIRSVTDHDLAAAPVFGVDLSVGSRLVSGRRHDNRPEALARRLAEAMAEEGASIGAGGYNEARLIYPTSGRVIDEQRTVHLGVDLTLAAGSSIRAPLTGVVHGFEYAAQAFDYGPVIVLRHDVTDDSGPLTFYTLYGHLDRAALDGLVTGAPIAAGSRLGAVGTAEVNGGWWPHLHLQIITDMLDVPCNFNGVAPASQRATWLSLCPDPNLLLGIPLGDLPQPHPATADLAAERQVRVGRNVRLSYGSDPLQLVRGWMQYLYDETGRTYVDAYNNVPHVGHAHPGVARAVAAQLATLNTNTRYLHETLNEYAAALLATFPDPLSVCFFTASGSEANELAIRLARAQTGQRHLIVMEGAYHGHTTTLIDASPYKHNGPGGLGAPDWVHASPVPDVYRGAHKASDPEAGLRYAREVGSLIDRIQMQGRGLCGYLAETCPSVGGQLFMPPGFLPEVYRLVREAGGLCIADEVQTGLGRIGSHFWAFEAHAVVPDIVVLGKPIANGYPVGAVVTTAAIADSFDNGMEFFSTFGGSTAACAAGLATLRVTIQEGLQAHAARVGAHLLAGLRQLQDRHPLIGDVRGSGLFIGVELVKDRHTLEPASEEAARVVNRMRDRGILIGTDGPYENVLKIRGPMPLTVQDLDWLVEALDEALD